MPPAAAGTGHEPEGGEEAGTPADEATAKEVHAYWANFAKHGNPNGPGVPHWPRYNASTDMLMNFTEAGPTPMADPWATRLNVTAERADALQKKMPKKPAS